MYITLKLRLSDKHNAGLRAQARAVNFVWNYCNETQQKAARDQRRWLSWIDLKKLTAGSNRMLGLHSHTVQQVCISYDKSRKEKRRPWLNFRSKKSLGWVPFCTGTVAFDGSGFVFYGVRYTARHLRDMLIPGMKFGAGSFNADARGNWYINLPCKVAAGESSLVGAVGIDLGLKTLATLSSGDKIEMPRFYRESEQALATAQRARKTKRARAIHAKARNRRKDFLHKASAALAKEYGTIVVGDVSPSKLAKTHMAKSVYDASWAGFKYMLSYKAIRHGG